MLTCADIRLQCSNCSSSLPPPLSMLILCLSTFLFPQGRQHGSHGSLHAVEDGEAQSGALRVAPDFCRHRVLLPLLLHVGDFSRWRSPEAVAASRLGALELSLSLCHVYRCTCIGEICASPFLHTENICMRICMRDAHVILACTQIRIYIPGRPHACMFVCIHMHTQNRMFN